MDDTKSLARQMRQNWLQQGLRVNEPNLAPLAPDVRNHLAPDLVTFLEVAGLPDESDALLIEWWEPSKWKVVNGSLLAFADYLLDSHLYALWLTGAEAGKVAVLLDTNPQSPIGTTAEFLAAYLADDLVLYG